MIKVKTDSQKGHQPEHSFIYRRKICSGSSTYTLWQKTIQKTKVSKKKKTADEG